MLKVVTGFGENTKTVIIIYIGLKMEATEKKTEWAYIDKMCESFTEKDIREIRNVQFNLNGLNVV